MHGFQTPCNAFTRHSNYIKIKKRSLSSLICEESTIGKHIIQTCGQRACVCAYDTKKIFEI